MSSALAGLARDTGERESQGVWQPSGAATQAAAAEPDHYQSPLGVG